VIVRKIVSSVIVACLFFLVAETSAGAAPAAKKKPQVKPALSGIASVYSYKKRSRSASGEFINFKTLIAAHRTLRFGTKVRVTNRNNGKSVVVRIIDRGPFIRGRVIDLSPAAAREIGLGWGLAPVTLAVVSGAKA
jgi:rare lipoprotein A